jgi:hypothetical protein
VIDLVHALGPVLLVALVGCGPTRPPAVAQRPAAATSDETPESVVGEPSSPEPSPKAVSEPEPEPEPQPEPEPEPEPPTLDELATIEDVGAFLRLPELASARVFAINVHIEEPGPEEVLIDDLGQLNPDRRPAQGVPLSTDQLIELIRATLAGSTFGGAYCFEPHHAVALYDASDRPLGELTICFSCGRMHSTIKALRPDPNFDVLEAMMRRLEVPMKLPMRGLAPTLGRPSVREAVTSRLERCNKRGYAGATHGHPALSIEVHVGADGKVSQLVGLDESTEVGACMAELLRAKAFRPTKAASVHAFTFPAAAAKPGKR